MRLVILVLAGIFLAAIITGQWLGLAIIAFVLGAIVGAYLKSEADGMRRTRR